MLKPQDLLVAIGIALVGRDAWTYEGVASKLGISASEAHAAVKRAQGATLLLGREVDRRALLEFLEHGVRYAFYVERGPVVRGVPTGVGAPPLRDRFQATEIPVWPSAGGTARGYALAPLYRSVPAAAEADRGLYEVLALVDAIRDGGTRERTIAMEELRSRLGRPIPTTDRG